MVDKYTWCGVLVIWILCTLAFVAMMVVGHMLQPEPQPAVPTGEELFMKMCKENGFECHVLPRQ